MAKSSIEKRKDACVTEIMKMLEPFMDHASEREVAAWASMGIVIKYLIKTKGSKE